MIVVGFDEAVADWVADFGGKPFHTPYTAFGVVDANGVMTGGYVFTGYNGDGIEMSMAGKGAVTRDGMRAVLGYVFDQLGCSRLQVHTRYSNKAVKAMLPRMGAKYEGVARKFYGKEDGILYSLTIDDLPGFKARWRL